MTTQSTQPTSTDNTGDGPQSENTLAQPSLDANGALLAARAAGEANARAWIRVAARELRAALPAAHTLLVDTESWGSDRGGARPDIRAVLDERGAALWDEGDDSPAGVALSDQINDVCTTLHVALSYCLPQDAPGWENAHGCCDPTYVVTLPHDEAQRT